MNKITKEALRKIEDLSMFVMEHQHDIELNIILNLEALNSWDEKYLKGLNGVSVCNLDFLFRSYINTLETLNEEDRTLLLTQLKYFTLGYRDLLNPDGSYNPKSDLAKIGLSPLRVKDLMSSPEFSITSFFGNESKYDRTFGYYFDTLLQDLDVSIGIYRSGIGDRLLSEIIENEFDSIYTILKDYTKKRIADSSHPEIATINKVINGFVISYAERFLAGTAWELPQLEYYHCSSVRVIYDDNKRYRLSLSGRYFSLKSKERHDFAFTLTLEEFLGFEPKQIDLDKYFRLLEKWRNQ